MKSSLFQRVTLAVMALSLSIPASQVFAASSVSKITVPTVPIRVYAIGGFEGATVYWQTPTSNGGKPITAYKITSFDQGKARWQTSSDGTTSFCNSAVDHCHVAIANPERNRIKTLPSP